MKRIGKDLLRTKREIKRSKIAERKLTNPAAEPVVPGVLKTDTASAAAASQYLSPSAPLDEKQIQKNPPPPKREADK